MSATEQIERVLGGLPNAQPAAVDRLTEILKNEVALLAPAFRLEIANDELRRAREALQHHKDAITQFDVGASISDDDVALWNNVIRTSKELQAALSEQGQSR